MRNAILKTRSGEDVVRVFNIEDFPYQDLRREQPYIVNRHASSPKNYLKIFATFDIETTTIDPPDRQKEKPYGFMYHWQMVVGGVPVYGRTWSEWFIFLKKIIENLGANDEMALVIYVFNLSFEAQFMNHFLRREFGHIEVFATAPREPLRITAGPLEFRCAYRLTNMTLAKAIDNELGTVHIKAKGDLDYKKIRTPSSYLDDIEFSYCISDVVGLYELIVCRMKNEKDNLQSIPMTSTGYVRRDCRNATRKQEGYREDYFLKNKMTSTVYGLLKEAGRGGNTHANRFLAGRILHGVDSYDIASSYPYQLYTRDFPCKQFSPYGEIESLEELEDLLSEYACLFRVIFEGIQVKENVMSPYIASAKCLYIQRGAEYDNGRILSGNITLTVTDIDFKIIREQYTWDSVSISDMHIAEYGRLPESLRDVIMGYFVRKCELKIQIKRCEDPERKAELEYFYGKSKNLLNSCFGMAYTDPIRAVVTLNDSGDWETIPGDIEEGLAKFYGSRNNFMVYAVGVWCTAWARLSLEKLLNATNDTELGNYAIYCDTDSSKCIIADPSPVDKLNDEIERLDEELGAYCDVDGMRFYLGVYELETDKEKYKRFSTLGAKKYAYEDSDGLHITIAGVNKKLGAIELGELENFKPGFIFRDAGGQTLYYNDAEIHTITIQGEEIETAANIGLVDSTYELGITGEYAELIGINLTKEELS